MSSLVNPYEPSDHPAASLNVSSLNENPIGRSFDARLTWPDRRILLRTIAPIRFAMMAGAVLAAKNIYDLSIRFYNRWNDFDPLGSLLDGIMAMLTCVVVAQLAVTLYACWIGWLAADRLQAVVGGRTRSWSAWSRLHNRSAWCAVMAGILGLTTEVVYWLVSQAVALQAERFMRDG